MLVTETLISNTDSRGVATLVLNRPARRNALDGDLVQALLQQLEILADDVACRVLVLTGQGDSFCSGADLAWIQHIIDQGEAANQQDAQQLASLMYCLNVFPKPTIALVNGSAYGGGLGLIACCDMAIAASHAEFAFTEVRLGLVAAVIAPYILAAIGVPHSRRLLLSASKFDATQAESMGLVYRVAQAEQLTTILEQQLSELLKGDAKAQTKTKQLLLKLKNMDARTLEFTADLTACIRASDNAKARMRDFLVMRGSKHGGKHNGGHDDAG